jgi:pimeloyl-ACP methyl ester carboxylesterase
MITELEFRSRKDLVLGASLHRPSDEASGGVIVCHGMLSSKESEKHVAVCEKAAARGLAALRFDFAGRGRSQGDDGDLTVSGEVEDLQAALQLMRELGFARPALVGSSLGGAVAVLVAAADREIAALVTAAAPAVLPKRPRAAWGVEAAALDAFFDDASRHDVGAAAARVTCPWLVIHGADDEVVPPEDARELVRANPSARLIMRPGADHRFADPAQRQWLVKTIVDALRRPD